MMDMPERYMYLMVCENCGAIRNISQENIPLLLHTKGMTCDECGTRNKLPEWLKRAIEREMAK